MTQYLVHKDFSGKPIGIWAENGESYYPVEHSLAKSASNLLANRKEPWSDYVDRIADRVSYRDWWEVHTSKASGLVKVWQEVVPESSPIF